MIIKISGQVKKISLKQMEIFSIILLSITAINCLINFFLQFMVSTAVIRKWKKCDRVEKVLYIMAIYLLLFYQAFSMLFAVKYLEMCDYVELTIKNI